MFSKFMMDDRSTTEYLAQVESQSKSGKQPTGKMNGTGTSMFSACYSIANKKCFGHRNICILNSILVIDSCLQTLNG